MTDNSDLARLLDDFASGHLETDDSKLSKLAPHSIFLYGAGNIGKRLYKNLTSNDIEVIGFIDRKPDLKLPEINAPVYQPADPELTRYRKSSIIILSGLFPVSTCKQIKTSLCELGFQHVYALHEINFSEVNNGSFYENLFDNSYNKYEILGTDRQKLENAFSLFHEEVDREQFLLHLKSHLTMDFVRLPEPHDISLQYMAHDIAHEKDYSSFVDCGGYNGDTLRQLTGNGCKIRHLAAFEPQVSLYNQYVATVRSNSHSLQSAILFPCGVYSETRTMRFSSCPDADSTGKVDDGGDELIQCVKLDDALCGFTPTFIKMDIEGAETEALRGASGLIQSCAPQLAICVYHSLSDFWEVPNFIRSLRNDYKYYLRNYNYMGLETVLYAFPDAHRLV